MLLSLLGATCEPVQVDPSMRLGWSSWWLVPIHCIQPRNEKENDRVCIDPSRNITWRSGLLGGVQPHTNAGGGGLLRCPAEFVDGGAGPPVVQSSRPRLELDLLLSLLKFI
jgi:hypothetical protein